MKKKIALICCIVLSVLMMAGCSLVKENKNFAHAKLENETDKFVKNWFSADFTGTIQQYGSQLDADTLASYKQYAKYQKEYKGFVKKVDTDFTVSAKNATVTETVLCKNNKKLLISLSFSEDGQIQQDEQGGYVFKVEEYTSLAQKMEKAGLNTVMSMAIVFCVLIFISLIISCFKFIGAVQNKSKKSQSAVVAQTPAEPVAEPSEENLMDDLELVAVITAAVAAASENECTDGLVVRSIVRRF